MSITIRDNGEPLVDIKKYCPGVIIKINPERMKREKTVYLRKTVAQMLKKASSHLPKGMRFIIGDAWRPAFVQARIYHEFIEHRKHKYPKWTMKQIIADVDTYVAPWKGVNASGHMSGGAIDLRLADRRGRKIPMKLRSLTYQENALTDQPKLPAYIKRNRKILIDAMKAGGLSNYPFEYWHWSYGDFQWARRNGKKVALYGAVSDPIGIYKDEQCPCGSGKKFTKCHA